MTAIGEIDKTTQSNAAEAKAVASAAEQLNAQAATLLESVGQLARLAGSSKNDATAPDVFKRETASRGTAWKNCNIQV